MAGTPCEATLSGHSKGALHVMKRVRQANGDQLTLQNSALILVRPLSASYQRTSLTVSAPTLLANNATDSWAKIFDIHGRVYERGPQAYSMPYFQSLRDCPNNVSFDACDLPFQQCDWRCLYGR